MAERSEDYKKKKKKKPGADRAGFVSNIMDALGMGAASAAPKKKKKREGDDEASRPAY
jgi:hypothetical protein